MGKRELVLVVFFTVIGVVVYQFTAPARAPGTEGASFSGIWHSLQHHIRGNPAVASVDSTQSAAADGIHEVRLTIPNASTVTVTGEERQDISASLNVEARGFDDAEAHATATAPHLTLERAGDAVLVRTANERGRPPSTPAPQVTLILRVPRQVAVHVEPNSGPLTITNVASVEVMGSRGVLQVSSIGGTAQITHSGGRLTIDGCQDLKLTNRAGVSTIRNITGEASIEPTGGQLALDHVTGPLEINSHAADLTLTGLDALKAPLRVDAVNGKLQIDGLRTDTQIESRGTPIDVTLAATAAVTIYSTAEDIAITPSSAGYTLDAVATNGRVAVDDAQLTVSTSGDDQRANGPVRGGGPMLVLRTTRADIRVRSHPSGK